MQLQYAGTLEDVALCNLAVDLRAHAQCSDVPVELVPLGGLSTTQNAYLPTTPFYLLRHEHIRVVSSRYSDLFRMLATQLGCGTEDHQLAANYHMMR